MTDEARLSQRPDPELAELVEGLIDGGLTTAQRKVLEDRLKDDPEAADYCAERLCFHAELAECLDPVRFELVQSRRVLIEGKGAQRRVVVGESQQAQIGTSRGGTLLPMGGAGLSVRTPRMLWMWVLLSVIGLGVVYLAVDRLRERMNPRVAVQGPESMPPPVQRAASPARPPESEEDLRFWLEDMVWFHRYNLQEIRAVTGLENVEIMKTLGQLDIGDGNRPVRGVDEPLVVLPYPGGRHPRNGWREKALDPQRDTKVSVFTPWDPESYVVLDLPEALIVNNLLYYVAHTDQPTVWSSQGIVLPRLEWERRSDGSLESERVLPNKIAFGAKVVAARDAVHLEMWIRNGTPATLTNMKFQNCVLLAGAEGFSAQTTENKEFRDGYAVCRSEDGGRWIISSWEQGHRLWEAAECPCMHTDPLIPMCEPGQTVRLHGWLSFYEGDDLDGELQRIEATGWRGGR